MRRSLAAAVEIPAGQPVRKEWLTWARPAWGLGPDRMGDVIGKSLNKPLKAGALIRSEDLAESTPSNRPPKE